MSVIDELIKDINSSEEVKLTLMIHSGVDVKVVPISYSKLKIKKDDNGNIFLGNYQSQEGYIVNTSHEIIKSTNSPGTIKYIIEKEGIRLIDIYIK